jgi:hypothetical protein
MDHLQILHLEDLAALHVGRQRQHRGALHRRGVEQHEPQRRQPRQQHPERQLRHRTRRTAGSGGSGRRGVRGGAGVVVVAITLSSRHLLARQPVITAWTSPTRSSHESDTSTDPNTPRPRR